MKFVQRFLLGLSLIIGLSVGAAPLLASADTAQSTVCGAINNGGSCSSSSDGTSLTKVITAILNILSLAVGVIAVVMIVIAGLKYITSAGDSNGIASAKNTLVYAIVGIVIASLAQIIVKFVLQRLK